MTRIAGSEAKPATNTWVDGLLAQVAATPRDRVEAVVEFDFAKGEIEYRFTLRKAVAK
jgi:hypothetical protein